MKRLLLYAFILLLIFSLIGCSNAVNKVQSNTGAEQNSVSQQNDNSSGKAVPPQNNVSNEKPVVNNAAGPIVYKNAQYGFSFSLPESWKGYKVITDKWEGLAIGGAQGEAVVESGPMISIRHPQWTAENPRQDIPIMVFTMSQWNSLLQNKFHIGAAPIGPSELGRNTEYVFALPARYNFAFPTGYEEVEAILQGKPLQTDKQ